MVEEYIYIYVILKNKWLPNWYKYLLSSILLENNSLGRPLGWRGEQASPTMQHGREAARLPVDHTERNGANMRVNHNLIEWPGPQFGRRLEIEQKPHALTLVWARTLTGSIATKWRCVLSRRSNWKAISKQKTKAYCRRRRRSRFSPATHNLHFLLAFGFVCTHLLAIRKQWQKVDSNFSHLIFRITFSSSLLHVIRRLFFCLYFSSPHGRRPSGRNKVCERKKNRSAAPFNDIRVDYIHYIWYNFRSGYKHNRIVYGHGERLAFLFLSFALFFFGQAHWKLCGFFSAENVQSTSSVFVCTWWSVMTVTKTIGQKIQATQPTGSHRRTKEKVKKKDAVWCGCWLRVKRVQHTASRLIH